MHLFKSMNFIQEFVMWQAIDKNNTQKNTTIFGQKEIVKYLKDTKDFHKFQSKVTYLMLCPLKKPVQS